MTEFLAGALAFMAHTKLTRLGFLIPFGLGAALVIFFGFYDPTLYAVGLFFLIVSFANLKSAEGSWWQKPAILLGDASYSVYLIHPMVFFTASSLVSKFPRAPLWTEEPIRFACIVAAITLALLSWRYFEKPIIGLGNRLASVRPKSASFEELAAGSAAK